VRTPPIGAAAAGTATPLDVEKQGKKREREKEGSEKEKVRTREINHVPTCHQPGDPPHNGVVLALAGAVICKKVHRSKVCVLREVGAARAASIFDQPLKCYPACYA
jgi:hypothetical protein